jgi:nucleoside phosphorylase
MSRSMQRRRLSLQDYTIAILCALPIELAAAQTLLDQTHPTPSGPPGEANDGHAYTFGSIGDHNVVIGCLSAGRTGLVSAASAARGMSAKFRNLRFGLMVGIGGGVPSSRNDVRLGDVVVSQPHDGHGGVIQYDFGRRRPDGFEPTGFLNSPPELLLQTLAHLQARHIRGENSIETHLAVVERNPRFRRPTSTTDMLFEPAYDHVVGQRTCQHCDRSQIVARSNRESNGIEVHYGNIASGNCVMRDARERDAVSALFNGVLCFEMEAAGLLNHWPCLVIRGICDYADSHKNDEWQPYAAGVAAAYAKDLLLSMQPTAGDPDLAGATSGDVATRLSFDGASAMFDNRVSPGSAGQEQQSRGMEQSRIQGTVISLLACILCQLLLKSCRL